LPSPRMGLPGSFTLKRVRSSPELGSMPTRQEKTCLG
jgi:hypothetical protein